MKIKTLFTVTAVISFFYAVNLFFMPGKYLEMRGLNAEEAGIFMTRIAGMVAVAFIFFGWFSRNMENPKDLRGMAIAFYATFASGAIVLLMGKLSIESLNGMGWVDFGVAAAFTIAYGYYVFSKPKAA